MSLSAKQKRFAEEYSVDHNGSAAAVRAGYAERTARQAGSRLLATVSVRQLVARLDSEKRVALGLEGAAELAEVGELLAAARVLQPRIWKGRPVVYTDPHSGEVKTVTEFRAAALAGRLAELKVRLAGLLEPRSGGPVFGEVVYKLTLDRDLSEEEG
jgi:hypothetical protein